MEARKAIEAINDEFDDAYNRGDAAGTATGYIENCALLAPDQSTIHGRQAVEAFFKEQIEVFGGTVNHEIVEVVVAGDVAYQWGTYTVQSGEESDEGKLVEIFNRQADGSWKIRLSIFNSDIPVL